VHDGGTDLAKTGIRKGGTLLKVSLHFGHGVSWRLSGAGAAEIWLERFAHAMGLSAARDGMRRQIVFEEMPMRPGEFFGPVLRRHLKELPRGKWKVREFSNLAFFEHPAREEVFCELSPVREWRGRVDQMRRSLLPVYLDALASGGLPIHGALIAKDGHGVILAGCSGAGKSTASRRVPPPWQVLGDDLCLVVQDEKGTCRVHPLPTWSAFREDGKSGVCRSGSAVDLRAVFFLEQAPVDDCRALKSSTAAISLAASSLEVFRSVDIDFPSREEAVVKKGPYANAASLALRVPSFLLRLSLKGRFWEKIEEALGLQGKAEWRNHGLLEQVEDRPGTDALLRCVPAAGCGGSGSRRKTESGAYQGCKG